MAVHGSLFQNSDQFRGPWIPESPFKNLIDRHWIWSESVAGLIFTEILPPIHQPCQGCGQSYHYFWFSLDHLQAGACSGLLSPCIILSEITLLNSFWLQMNPKLHLALLVVFIAAVHSAPATKESVLSTQVRKSLWHKILLKGRMKWTGKRGPKDAYWYCELPLTIENQIFLNYK